MQTQQVEQMTKRKSKTLFEWLILVGLLLSFVFYGMFEAFVLGNGSYLVSSRETAATAYFSYVLFFAVLGWLVFELAMRAYYFFVSLSIYVFVVPKRYAYYTLRVGFLCRNLLVGALSLLLFVSPIWIGYLPFLTLLIDFGVLCGVFFWLKKKYLGVLFAPFAWKAFLRPFLVYEFIAIAFEVVSLL